MSKNVKAIAPIIFGCAGTSLTLEEKSFFEKTQATGFILFKRNCDNPAQVQALIAELKSLCRHKALMLIDQEGGKVARLTPPHWEKHPPAAYYGALYQQDQTKACQAVYEGAKKIAQELKALGFNINCFPVLDIPIPRADDVIGSRAYGDEAQAVAKLGKAAAAGLTAGGILPVIKHLPGHGRAEQDSHKALPVVSASLEALRGQDFIPFQALKEAPLGMTAHIVYQALDERAPATFSKRIISEIVRTEIGFGGLLLSDDINMNALEGDLPSRALKALASGCDIVLHCSGKLEEMALLAKALPLMAEDTASRLNQVLGAIDD